MAPCTRPGRLQLMTKPASMPVQHFMLAQRRCSRRLAVDSSKPVQAVATPDGEPLASELQAQQAIALDQAIGLPSKRRRVALLVEPSPFSHVSGMKNRFECLIRSLRELGDDVLVITPDPKPPKQFFGARVLNVLGFRLPFYSSPTLLLSFGLSLRVLWQLIMRRPDVLHVSSPGLLVFAAILYAKLLDLPLVVSYHTNVPAYIPKYTWRGLVQPMWCVIRFCTWISDVTLVTSDVMKRELTRNKCHGERIEVWQRGVDTAVFHPRFRSQEMRARLSDGHLEAPLLVHVGRLGEEKNLKVLKGILQQLPEGTRLAFVGDGPARSELEAHFADVPTVKFMGMLQGEDLSAAYASGDVFMMPSESETLGFVALEAMASGLPVVAVAAGGLTDILTKPGVTGFLYPPGDYAQATRITADLIASAERRQQVGAAARCEVEPWGWRAATERLRAHQYGRAIQRNLRRRWIPWLAIRASIAAGLRWVLLRLWRGTRWLSRRLIPRNSNDVGPQDTDLLGPEEGSTASAA